MWDLIRSGGPVMIPILLCSVVALGLILERLLTLRRKRIVVPEVVEVVETLAASRDFSQAYAILKRKPGPFANLVRAGLDHAGDDWRIIQNVLQEAGRQEAVRLTRHLRIIETMAAIAPLLGFLGTVTGMMRIFTSVSTRGLGDTFQFSSGLAEALVTTVFGLSIGIPTLVAHNWLEGRAAGIVFELECYATKLLDTLRDRHARSPGRMATDKVTVEAD